MSKAVRGAIMIISLVLACLAVFLYLSKGSGSYGQYMQAMSNDIHGGKTQDETIRLLVEALNNNDAELASKYFALDADLSRDKWLRTLTALRQQGVLGELAKDVNMDTVTFEFNKYTGVWKILNFK